MSETRWATFDCYGTLIDWNLGIRTELERVFGVAEPDRIKPLANDGKASPHLPAGTLYGLVGSSSLYKRESYPYGVAPPGSVTATFAEQKDASGHRGFDTSHNWSVRWTR